MRRFIPSPAMCVAVLALMVAGGGVSYAAVKIDTEDLARNAVTSKKIKNETIKVKDINPTAASALRGQTGPQGPQGPAGPAGAAAFTDAGVAASTNEFNTNSAGYVNVTNANTTITVPPGKTATVIAHFSAESTCDGAGGWCSVRVLLDGVEMNPQEGTNSAFDSADGAGQETFEHNALVRSRTGVGPGNHTVQVQAANIGSTSFRLDDLSLAVTAVAD